MYNNIIKHKRPQIKPLQTILPKAQFQTVQNPQYQVRKFKTKAPTTQNQYSQNTITINPFQKKSYDKNLMAYGNQSINHGQRIHLQKKIPSNQINKNRQIYYANNLRYSQHDQNPKKSPYIRFDNRQSLLNRSNKIRSGSISKNFSPTNILYPKSNILYPKSSLSNPYEVSRNPRKVLSVQRNNEYHQQNSINLLFEQGKKYYLEDKLYKAIQCFQRLLSNRKNPQAQYLLAICYMNSGKYQKGINAFYQITIQNPSYKRNIYLLTAIAYKKLNKIFNSIQIISKGITLFPDYYDSLVYRGKLYLKQMMWEKAISDFQLAIQKISKKYYPYIGKAEALKQLGKKQQAINCLNQTINGDLQNASLLKRGILYFQLNQLQRSLDDLNKYMENDNNNSQVYYYKGLIYKKKKLNLDALLNFEQCIKKDNNENLMNKSIEQMLKIKIEEKDFYEAFHIISRIENIEINKKGIEDWKAYIEGSLFLMKKKYEEGISLFNYLLSEKQYSKKYSQTNINKQKYEFLKPLIHLYRAYGNFSLGNLKQVKQDYNYYDKFYAQIKQQESDPSKKYNSHLLKIIQNFPKCKQYIQQAQKLYPTKSQPYLYMALYNTQQFLSNTSSIHLIKIIKQNLSKAIQFLPQLSNNHTSSVYYHRAVIHLYTNQFQKSVNDIDKAIQKSQDNIPKYFYLRGLIFEFCGNYNQAIQDFSVAINLNQDFSKCYLQRAKCLQMQGNSNDAFLDLQKYITLKPNDPLIHKYAGFLLFQNCAYDDCLSAFSHGPEKIVDLDIIETKIKCYLFLGKYKNMLKEIEIYHNQTGQLNYVLDSLIINMIDNIQNGLDLKEIGKQIGMLTKIIESNQNSGKLFQYLDILLIRGALFLIQSDFLGAKKDFKEVLKLKQKKFEKKIILNQSSVLQQSNQMNWSLLQIKYCLSICYIGLKDYQRAFDTFSKMWIKQQAYEDIDWTNYKNLLQFLIKIDSQKNIQQFQKIKQIKIKTEDKKFSSFLPVIQIPIYIQNITKYIKIELLFNYPEIVPPELQNQFDYQLLQDFNANKIEYKPEAPWINRNTNGVVFTSNVEILQNLQLSISDKKNEGDDVHTIRNMDSMRRLSYGEGLIIQRKDLRERLRLDDQIEKKLDRIFKKLNK